MKRERQCAVRAMNLDLVDMAGRSEVAEYVFQNLDHLLPVNRRRRSPSVLISAGLNVRDDLLDLG